MNKQIIKNTLILVCITLTAGLLLGFVYDITKEPIAEQKKIAKAEACEAVFAEADSFDTEHPYDVSDAPDILKGEYESCSIDEAVPALDAEGNLLGYAMTVTCSEGYGGDLTFMMGVTTDGMLNGIDFLSLSETAGLGMNAAEPEFKEQFEGRTSPKLTVTKDTASGEEEIQAISSATITSNAVTKGVNAGLLYYRAMTGQKGGNSDE